MALSDEELRNVAARIRLEQCVKPRNVLERVIDRVSRGEPFALFETVRDDLGTLPVPGAYHLRVNAGGRLRWMALRFADPALPGEGLAGGRLYRQMRWMAAETDRVVIYREECRAPSRLGAGGDQPLEMTCGDGLFELIGPGLGLHVLAAHEIVEGPYGLAILAGRVRKGLPVGMQLAGLR